jgi:hypothetical protein
MYRANGSSFLALNSVVGLSEVQLLRNVWKQTTRLENTGKFTPVRNVTAYEVRLC